MGLLALLPAAGARAATVTLEYEAPIRHVEPDPAYTLAVEAEPGESNRLRLLRDERGFVVREASDAALSAGPRCETTAPGEVRCPLSGDASHLSVFVDAGDGDDVVVLGPLPGIELAEALGGPGNDVLWGHEGADLLLGGPGADVLAGFAGPDRIDGGPGDDLMHGGGGRDLVTYASRTAPARVNLATGAGGTEGELDRHAGFEDAAGGRGSDELIGDAGPNLLYGGLGGRDVARGRAGDDTLSARRSIGGPGDDIVDGESVACGRGRDLVARLRFQPSGPYGRGCERVRNWFYNVTRPRLVRRKLRFAVSCPVRTCRGSFVVRDARGRIGASRYSALGESFGGRPDVPISIPLDRLPARGRAELVIQSQSLARDSFRLRLR